MTKKRIPIFYIVYFFLVLLALGGIAFGMIWLNGLLAEYESSRPEYVADAVFEKYYKSGDFSKLAEVTYDEDSYNSIESITAFLNEQYGDTELTYTSVSSGDTDVLKYIIKAGDYKISSFTLKKSGETTERGFAFYTEDSLEVYYVADKSAGILVPDFSDVYINGKKLGKENVVQDGIILQTADKTPEGVNPVQYTRYAVEGLIEEPDVKVMSGDVENEVLYNAETKEYEASLPNNAELEAEHKEFVIAAIEEYAKYMEMDSHWGAVSPYFETGTFLYNSIRTVANYLVYPHDGYRFEDEYAGEFYAYNEDTFSCRVSVVQILENAGMEDFYDEIDMTVYLRRVGDRFLIYDWNVIGD